MDRHEYELRARGYTYLRGTLLPQYIVQLREAIDEALAADVREHGRDALMAMGQYGALRNLPALSSVFHPLIDHPPTARLMDALLGSERVMHSFDALVLDSGEGRYPCDFHTDLKALDGVAFPANRPPAVNCLYFVDGVCPDNGATRLVPASHFSLLVDPQPEALAELAVASSGDPGDAMLFDARLWHCAGNNQSDGRRRLIKTLFAQPWIVQQMDYFGALPQQQALAIGPERLRLLGREARAPGNLEELRHRLSNGCIGPNDC